VPGKGAAWAAAKLGVRERRFAVPLSPLTGYPVGRAAELDLAARAATAALERAVIEASEIDGLWYVSCTQSDAERHFGRMALGLHRRLGLRPEAFALELDAGCGGAVHAIAAAMAQMRGADLRRTLITATNMPSQYFAHWAAYAQSGAWLSMYLFGDGAGAVVLEQSDDAAGGILAAYTAVDPNNPLMAFACPEGQTAPLYLIDGRGVALGFRGYARAALEALRCRHPFRLDDIRRFYFHQVNAVILRQFVGELGIPEERVAIHVDRYGNLASAATLVLLDEDIRLGVVGAGDLCVVCTVGAGAQYGALLLEI
jgi:3-oxoacyl-[acyl-carrier-protein] synthase III